MQLPPVTYLCLHLLLLVPLVSSDATLSPQNAPTDLKDRASLSSADIKAYYDLLSRLPATNDTLGVGFEGCYVPAPGLRVIKTQDVILALALLATGSDFDVVQTWARGLRVASWGGVVVTLVHRGGGSDRFSGHEVAIRAMSLAWYCVVSNPAGLGGGASM
ncbi:MAG: hypothetical protein LQ345_004468 [Seirophora villosa]|nr:MAG: hypothetical protein LQ345_004468 [Seirophora villosa]